MANINSIKNRLLILNTTEESVTRIQNLIYQARKLTPEQLGFEFEEVHNEFIRETTLLPIVENYKPSSLNSGNNSDLTFLALSPIQQLDEFQAVIDKYSLMLFEKRKGIASSLLLDIFEEVEDILSRLKEIYIGKGLPSCQEVEDSSLPRLKDKISEIEICIGARTSDIDKWSNINRHLAFGQISDLEDIINRDWPSIKQSILIDFFQLDLSHISGIDLSEKDSIGELRNLVKYEKIRKKFDWKDVSSEEFERLIFQVLSSQNSTYENVEFLMRTNAPDCGRDISAHRVYQDSFSGVIRYRVIIQCKHWLGKSLSVKDISYLKDQIKLWEPPRIDVLIVATTGYFSADAVKFMEIHNQSSSPLRMEFWPIERIKKIMESRPHLLESFKI